MPDAEAHVKEGKARGRAARKLVPRSSLAYADQNELDYQAMLDAAADGRIEVQPSDR